MRISGFEYLTLVIVLLLPLALVIGGDQNKPATTLEDGDYTTGRIHALFNEQTGLPVYRFIADKGKFVERMDGGKSYIDPEPTLRVVIYEIPRTQLSGVTDNILEREHVRMNVHAGIGKIVMP